MSWMRHKFASRGRPVPPAPQENALVMAISNGDRGWLQSLLAGGADANVAHRGTLPLPFAARRGEFDIVDSLIAHGADIDARNEKGLTALMDAAVSSHAEMLQGLLARGAKTDKTDYSGKTALHYAAHTLQFGMIESLVMAGADADATDHKDESPRDICEAAGRFALTALESAEKRYAEEQQKKTAALARSLSVMKPAAVRSRIAPR